MTDTLPQQPVAGVLDRAADGRRWSLALDREVPHPAEDVWAALTEAERVRRWAPFTPGHDLDAPGAVELAETGAEEAAPMSGEVRTARAPRLLVLDWGPDELRLGLAPADTGTRLRLLHTFAEPERAAGYAAGWHLCLAALAGTLDGLAVPPVAGAAARRQGWDLLRDQYTDLFDAG
jgi:uncharacterized protein YndB with AHSA1/START domain